MSPSYKALSQKETGEMSLPYKGGRYLTKITCSGNLSQTEVKVKME